MEWIGVIGIVAGLVFFVIAAMRGWNVLITSIVTAIIIALTNGMDIMNTMVGTETSYATGLAGFIRGNLMIFMGGAIMGEFMDKSGAAKAIAQAINGQGGNEEPVLRAVGHLGCGRSAHLRRHLDVRGHVRPHPAGPPDVPRVQHPVAFVLRRMDAGRLLVHHGHDPRRARPWPGSTLPMVAACRSPPPPSWASWAPSSLLR